MDGNIIGAGVVSEAVPNHESSRHVISTPEKAGGEILFRDLKDFSVASLHRNDTFSCQ
jgi:hypothetical protein